MKQEKIVWNNLIMPKSEPIAKAKEYTTMVYDEAIVLSDLLDRVYVHDYSYMMSDDLGAWERGKNNERYIKELIDVLVTQFCVNPIDLVKQLLECRSEQYTDGLSHRIIKGWFAIYM